LAQVHPTTGWKSDSAPKMSFTHNGETTNAEFVRQAGMEILRRGHEAGQRDRQLSMDLAETAVVVGQMSGRNEFQIRKQPQLTLLTIFDCYF
jgi:hypothetical protein